MRLPEAHRSVGLCCVANLFAIEQIRGFSFAVALVTVDRTV